MLENTQLRCIAAVVALLYTVVLYSNIVQTKAIQMRASQAFNHYTVWPLINDFAGAPTEHDPNTK